MQPPVHVAITRTVKPGCEEAFERALQDFFSESLRDRQSLGALLIRPLSGSGERTYGILRSFASVRDRDDFYASDRFRAWGQTVAPLVNGDYTRRDLHGLEAFFDRAAQTGSPPKWKMTIVTWLGVWPTSYIVASILTPALHGQLPRWLAAGVMAACITVGLSWVVMPVLVKLFKPWLQKGSGKEYGTQSDSPPRQDHHSG